MGKSAGRGLGKAKVKIGVAGYNREEWDKLKKVAADPKNLEETYEAWCRAYEKGTRMLQRTETKWVRVPILADELVKLCTEEDRPLDSRARSEYAARKLQASEGLSPGS